MTMAIRKEFMVGSLSLYCFFVISYLFISPYFFTTNFIDKKKTNIAIILELNSAMV